MNTHIVSGSPQIIGFNEGSKISKAVAGMGNGEEYEVMTIKSAGIVRDEILEGRTIKKRAVEILGGIACGYIILQNAIPVLVITGPIPVVVQGILAKRFH